MGYKRITPKHPGANSSNMTMVGIGVDDPKTNLDVLGDVRIRDSQGLFFKRHGDDYAWRIRNESSADGTTHGFDNQNDLVFEVVSNSGVITGSGSPPPSATSHTIYTSSENTLVLTEDGNVGIGTAPQSFSKLQVKAATDQHVSIFSNSSGLTIGGLTDVGGSGALRIAGSPLHLTGSGGGAGSGPDIAIISGGNVGIGDTNPNMKFVVKGTAGAGVVGLAKFQHTATHTYVPTSFIGPGRSIDLMSNSNSDDDTTGIRFSNPGGSRETFVGVEQTGGQGDVVVQGYDGVGYSEKARITHDGIYQQTGQRNLGGHKLVYHTVAYGFSHNAYSTAGTPSNSNPHWLEIPLFAGYSESRGGGFCEIDICWHATHAQAGHLHSWKLVWGSDHGRILNIAVVSSSATATTGSYNPYIFTSSSGLYRHPTSGDAYMTKLYIRIKGSTNHSGGRSILVRGMGGDVPGGTLGPIIDHLGDNTPDGISPTHLHSQTATG